jgi:predicted DCC family thiol-disulfide oxidoreductase YuxK
MTRFEAACPNQVLSGSGTFVAASMANPDNPIILYDGVCDLCNRMNQFVLARDRRDHFRFAALQSELGKRILLRHSINPDALDTVYVVLAFEQPGERLLARSEAVVHILRELGGAWSVMGSAFRVLPLALRNLLYNLVARNRYRLFGKFDTCRIPDAATRQKFLDV